MNISSLVKQANGFQSFNPMQTKVLEVDWENQNLVVASPTASGKTIIAELAGLNSILNKGKKAVYTCPLRALAHEHYRDLKEKYAQQNNIKMAVSTGDLDSSSKHLSKVDFIFTTYEKLDSLLVHRSEWLNQIGTLIIDEVHELDSDRGATLEMVITKLRILNPKIQIIALSATIPNADELSAWLNADLVESNYRPVPLKEGVYYDQQIAFKGEGKEIDFPGDDPMHSFISDTVKQKKQVLVFANTRKRAESLATQSSNTIFPLLSSDEKKELAKISGKIEQALETPTEQCKKLAYLVKNGSAFHHA
ncbi:MAG: DEAD/DEAH box helicase, partial [Candidatus Diapherotrites archaeon]